jgi:hypothetical protein
VAGLEFLGFTTEKAAEILARFESRPDDQCPDGIFDYAQGEIARLNSAVFRDLPPAQAMALLGISESLRDALLDPKFKQLFDSQTLLFWLYDTIESRHCSLVQLLDPVKQHAVRTLGNEREKKRAKFTGHFQSDSSGASSSPQLPIPTATIDTDDFNFPFAHVTVAKAGPILQDHTVLYKGKGIGGLSGASGRPLPFIMQSGGVNMMSIRTLPGGDFNQNQDAWYWTPDRETAEFYRRWAARRDPSGTTLLIRIQVPNTFFNALQEHELKFSNPWKEYIWYCRNEVLQRSTPAKFDKFWREGNGNADLVSGHICARSADYLRGVKKEEIRTKITEEHLLMIGPERKTRAKQCVVMHEKIADQMAGQIRGKIHIDVHHPDAK